MMLARRVTAVPGYCVSTADEEDGVDAAVDSPRDPAPTALAAEA